MFTGRGGGGGGGRREGSIGHILFCCHDSCLYLYHGTVIGGVSQCSSSNSEGLSGDCSGGVVLHPCCVGIEGQCILTTEENCSFQEGYWHPEKVSLQRRS